MLCGGSRASVHLWDHRHPPTLGLGLGFYGAEVFQQSSFLPRSSSAKLLQRMKSSSRSHCKSPGQIPVPHDCFRVFFCSPSAKMFFTMFYSNLTKLEALLKSLSIASSKAREKMILSFQLKSFRQLHVSALTSSWTRIKSVESQRQRRTQSQKKEDKSRRHALAAGDVRYVTELLGRPHRLISKVRTQDITSKRGVISLQTSSLLNLPPGNGVYKACSLIVGDAHPVSCKVVVDTWFLHIETEEVEEVRFRNGSHEFLLLEIEFS